VIVKRKQYNIKEVYLTIQGEGAQTGRVAVFVRFSGCNLWTGREQDRSKAVCKFCDTDFRGTDGPEGGKYHAEELAALILRLWADRSESPFIVVTGGEPLLQLDQHLVNTLHASHVEIAIETNGTLPAPEGIDWICVSPKARTEIVLTSGHELKIVYPQKELNPLDFKDWDFQVFSIQPMDGQALAENTQLATEFCLAHAQWKLSLQTHKLIGIP
jgi:7-carboxy-7-deazaguanine synthase (Cx14CxxC type)